MACAKCSSRCHGRLCRECELMERAEDKAQREHAPIKREEDDDGE